MEAKEFGEYLKEKRTEKKLTIRQLELRSGVSNAYISQMERGIKDIPSPDILKKLSTALGVTYEDLMEKAGYLNKNELIRNSIESGILNFDIPETDENSAAYPGFLALRSLNENPSLAKELTDEQLSLIARDIFPHLHYSAVDYLIEMQKDHIKANETMEMIKTIGSLSESDKKEVLNFLEFKKSQEKRQ